MWGVAPAPERPSRRSAFLALTLLASVASATPSRDPDAEEHARKFYEEGNNHYALNEYAAAIASFKEAYRLSEAPGLLFNIAQAYRLSGDCRDALAFYRSYLRADPRAGNRGRVAARITEMEECARRQPAPTPAEPEEPRPPIRTEVERQKSSLTRQKTDVEPMKSSVAPTGGSIAPTGASVAPPHGSVASTRESVAPTETSIAPIPTTVAPLEARSAPREPGPPGVPPTRARAVAQPSHAPSPVRANRIAGITLAVAGVAIAATGIYFSTVASSDGDAVSARFRNGGTWDAAARSLESEGEQAQIVAGVLYGVGAAAVVVGVTLAILGARAEHAATRGPVALRPAPGGVALSW